MMMYHSVQSQRYGRTKGLKVKHLAQLVVLTVLFTWFLYQLTSSHKAKVLSQRDEKENDIDDELLISDDKGGIDRTGVDHEDITVGEVAQDEFIDKKSVLKSRKIFPDLTDTAEREQSIAEGDHVEPLTEDVLDDSGEGDRDERGANSNDRARQTDETDFETKEGDKRSVFREGHKSLPYKRATETAEDRGDGEDEVQAEISAGEEFDGGEGWAAVKDDTLIYTGSENSKVKGIDVSELTNSNDANAQHEQIPHKEVVLAGSISSDSSVPTLRTAEDRKKNLTKPDDGSTHDLDADDETKSGVIATRDSSGETEVKKTPQNGEMTTTLNDAKSHKVTLVRQGHSKEYSVTGKMDSRSPHEFSEGTGGIQRNGTDAKVEQGRRTGMLGDGQEKSVSEIQQDKLVQQELIVEVVSEGKQGQPVQQEAIA